MNINTVRNILNILFMVGAIVGLVYYFTGHKETGTYIILVSMVVKFAEATLRMLKLK